MVQCLSANSKSLNAVEMADQRREEKRREAHHDIQDSQVIACRIII